MTSHFPLMNRAILSVIGSFLRRKKTMAMAMPDPVARSRNFISWMTFWLDLMTMTLIPAWPLSWEKAQIKTRKCPNISWPLQKKAGLAKKEMVASVATTVDPKNPFHWHNAERPVPSGTVLKLSQTWMASAKTSIQMNGWRSMRLSPKLEVFTGQSHVFISTSATVTTLQISTIFGLTVIGHRAHPCTSLGAVDLNAVLWICSESLAMANRSTQHHNCCHVFTGMDFTNADALAEATFAQARNAAVEWATWHSP